MLGAGGRAHRRRAHVRAARAPAAARCPARPTSSPAPPARSLYGALMGVLGAALGLALRSPAAAVITALVVLLALDPLFAGHQRRDRALGPGRRRGLAHRQRRGRPPAAVGGRSRAARLRGAAGASADGAHRPPRRALTWMRMLASVDGAIGPAEEARIPVSDEGLLRGDGAFEVMRLYSGRPFALEEHLRASAAPARACGWSSTSTRCARGDRRAAGAGRARSRACCGSCSPAAAGGSR